MFILLVNVSKIGYPYPLGYLNVHGTFRLCTFEINSRTLVIFKFDQLLIIKENG